ncbi:11701_t:CDS:2, partial [Funneliformis caledonium]
GLYEDLEKFADIIEQLGRAFWEQSEKPSLKNFLNFHLLEGDFEQEKMEHSQYKGYTATVYSAGRVLVVGKVACLLVSSIVNSILVSVLTNYPAGRVLAVGKVACSHRKGPGPKFETWS